MVAQLARMRGTELGEQCAVLERMMDRHTDDNAGMVQKIADVVDMIVVNFEETTFEAKAEADLVARVLTIVRELVQTFAEDKELQALALKMGRQEMGGKGGKGGDREEGEGSGHWGRPGGGASTPSGRKPTGRPSARPPSPSPSPGAVVLAK